MVIDVAELKRQAGKIWLEKKLADEQQAIALGEFYIGHKLSLLQIIALLRITEPVDFAAKLATHLWKTNQEALLRAAQNPRYTAMIKASVYKVHTVDPALAIALAIKLNFTEEEKHPLRQSVKSEPQTSPPVNTFTKTPIYTLVEKDVALPLIPEAPTTKREMMGSNWNIIDQNHGAAVAKLKNAQNNTNITSSGIYPSPTEPSPESWSYRFHQFKLGIYKLFNNVSSIFSSKKAESPAPVVTPERKQPLSDDESIETPERKNLLSAGNETVVHTPTRVKELSAERTVPVPTPERKNPLPPSSDQEVNTPPKKQARTNASESSYSLTTRRTARNLAAEFDQASKDNSQPKPRTYLAYPPEKDEQGNITRNYEDVTDLIDRVPGLTQAVDAAFEQHSYSAVLSTPPRRPQPTTASSCAAEFNAEQQTTFSPIHTPPRRGNVKS